MPSSQNRTSNRLLAVDDEPDVLDFLRIYLESHGWGVASASSAADALILLKQEPFFLVISDIAMPDMDGYEFMNRVRSLRPAPQLAVMTGFGYNPNHTLVRIHKNLSYPCLFKPFNRRKLVEVVKQAHDAYHANVPAQ